MICQTEIGQLGHMVPWCITEGPHRELASLWSTHWQAHWTYWTYWTGKISKQTFSLRSKDSSEPILVCLTEWDWLCNITLALCNQAVPCVSCKGDKGHLRPRLVIELSGPTGHTSPLLYTPLHFYHKSGILQISSSVQILTADCKTPTPRKVSENLFRNDLTILLKGCPLVMIRKILYVWFILFSNCTWLNTLKYVY